MRLLDAKFKYTPSTSTNITSTWRRFGFKPTTEAERTARQRRLQHPAAASMHTSAAVTPLAGKRKFANAPTLRLTVKK